MPINLPSEESKKQYKPPKEAEVCVESISRSYSSKQHDLVLQQVANETLDVVHLRQRDFISLLIVEEER
jgi:hypothetical protein